MREGKHGHAYPPPSALSIDTPVISLDDCLADRKSEPETAGSAGREASPRRNVQRHRADVLPLFLLPESSITIDAVSASEASTRTDTVDPDGLCWIAFCNKLDPYVCRSTGSALTTDSSLARHRSSTPSAAPMLADSATDCSQLLTMSTH